MTGPQSESIRVGGACVLVGLAGVGAVSLVRPDPGAERPRSSASLQRPARTSGTDFHRPVPPESHTR